MTSKVKQIVYCTLRMFRGQEFVPSVSELRLNATKSLLGEVRAGQQEHEH